MDMKNWSNSRRVSSTPWKLAMCALALLVAIACRGDGRERSESPTGQPEIFSSVPLPTSTPHPTATPDPAQLCRAVSRGRVGEVKRLIAANADVGARLCSGNPPLYTAVRYEEPEIARILVDAGADVNAIDKYGNPLLYTAVREEEPEIVRILVDAGADVNTRDPSGNPILYDLIWWGHANMVRILVDAGAEVDFPPWGSEHQSHRQVR